jgi:hypothetical protein
MRKASGSERKQEIVKDYLDRLNKRIPCRYFEESVNK